jgi:hypothetical protein
MRVINACFVKTGGQKYNYFAASGYCVCFFSVEE